MSTAEEVQALLQEVIGRFRARETLSLDELAEALEHPGVSYADVEAVIDALEAAGVDVGPESDVDVPQELAQVIGTARLLERELGRRPGIDEIATRAGLTRAAVQRALLYARTLAA